MIQKLLPLLANCNLTITFSQNEEIVTLIVAPKGKNKEATKFKPIIISGTADEVEAGWIDAIAAPLEKLKGLQIEAVAFEKSVEKAIEEKQAEATKKEKAAKKAEPKSAEKKPAELVKDCVAKGDKAFADKDYRQAEALYTEALTLKPGDKNITAKLQTAQRWVKSLRDAGMFEEKPTEPEVTPKESEITFDKEGNNVIADLHNENEPEEEHEGPGESEDNAKEEDFSLLD